MINPMFGHRPKPKKFDYTCRYYDPEKDKREKRRQRIKFKRPHKKHHQGRSVVLYTIALAFVVLLIYLLGGGEMADIQALFSG